MRGVVAARAKGGKGAGGRSRWLVLGLVGFFVLAMGVIARRTLGISQARQLRELDQRRDAMDAARVRLEAEIREASSRARLGPIVEQRLRMFVPADSQVIIISRPPARKTQ